MKQFAYTWGEEIFLLHLELNNRGPKQDYVVNVTRRLSDDGSVYNPEMVKKGTASHRFMISRSHPSEICVEIEYPDDVVLSVYELDDRAYYPTKTYFEG